MGRVVDAFQQAGDSGRNPLRVEGGCRHGGHREAGAPDVVAGVDPELEFDGQPHTAGYLDRRLEVEDRGVPSAELRVHGPSGVGVVVERSREGQVAGILLEGRPRPDQSNLLAFSTRKRLGEDPDAAQSQIAVVGPAGAALGQGGIGEGFEAQ